MLFIIQVVRVIPLFFNGSVVDVMTPYGIKSLVLEAGEEAHIRVPDFHTTLSFVYKKRRVSYPLVKLLERQHINFAPVPIGVDISMTRVMEATDTHFIPIGHRGSGSNEYRKKTGKPYIPENTISSYNHAYKLGANWVDVDISITSDNVVVVYHDFVVNDTPVWNMTLEQFKCHVEVLTTLESVVAELDAHINLAVEIKYPSIDEIKSENLGSAPEVKSFVNKLMDIVKKQNRRLITLNSFDPDVLIYVKEIAPNMNIFFNTEGVPNKFSDPRRNSLEDAIQFCLEYDLQGIVTDSETITSAPLMYTTYIHSLGLELMLYFYRSFSKKTDYVQEMTNFDCAGIDAIVVEDIPMALHVIKNLTKCSYDKIDYVE